MIICNDLSVLHYNGFISNSHIFTEAKASYVVCAKINELSFFPFSKYSCKQIMEYKIEVVNKFDKMGAFMHAWEHSTTLEVYKRDEVDNMPGWRKCSEDMETSVTYIRAGRN